MNSRLARWIKQSLRISVMLAWILTLLACGAGNPTQPASLIPATTTTALPSQLPSITTTPTAVVATPPGCLSCNRTISWPSPTPTKAATSTRFASATTSPTFTPSTTPIRLPSATLSPTQAPGEPPTEEAASAPSPTVPGLSFRIPPTGEIAFYQLHDQLYLRPADGSQPAELIYEDHHDKSIDLLQGISWAPDGKKFAFSITPWSDIAVYTLGASDLVNLTKSDNYFESDPAWSPNGKLIAFISDRRKIKNGHTWDIYTMRADGSQIKLLYECSGRCSHPEWSPDGKQIAFMMDKDLYAMDNTGKKVRNLTRGVSLNRFPAWSPDGEWIAFVRSSDYDTQSYIYQVKPDGSGLKRLTDDRLGPRQLSWSPDGQFLAFENMGEPFGIVIYEVETGATAFLASVAYAPAWRP